MGRIFYLDAVNGNDKNNGITPDEALKSLEAANRIVFGEGDKLLLKCGCVWKGMLCLHGDGDRFNFAQVGVYGNGEAPLIDGNGAYAAILLDGVSYWKVKGLRICNHSSERRVRQGICISAKPEGITAGIEISDCEIFEVDGENRRAMPVYQSMYWNGAVYVTFPGRTSAQDHLHDIIISNNYIHDVRTSGIRVNQQEDFINDIHHTHVVVRGNRIERTGSDGVIVANCISPLIDSNVCFDAGALGTLEDTQLIAGIWVCATRDALIQRNEVARTRMFENDGTAFDTDWGTAGTTVFQYNYSHDNEGRVCGLHLQLLFCILPETYYLRLQLPLRGRFHGIFLLCSLRCIPLRSEASLRRQHRVVCHRLLQGYEPLSERFQDLRLRSPFRRCTVQEPFLLFLLWCFQQHRGEIWR